MVTASPILQDCMHLRRSRRTTAKRSYASEDAARMLGGALVKDSLVSSKPLDCKCDRQTRMTSHA